MVCGTPPLHSRCRGQQGYRRAPDMPRRLLRQNNDDRGWSAVFYRGHVAMKRRKTMKFEFRCRLTGKVLYSQYIPDGLPETLRCKAALELAVKAGADLADADFARAN